MKKATAKPSTSKGQAPVPAELLPSHVSGFLDDIEANQIELHGFVILQHGKMVANGWWHPYGADIRHQLFSLSKSFTSTAAGFAVSENILSLDDSVISYFPDKVPKDANDSLRAMKIRHLLTMSTGHETEPDIREQNDWVKGFLTTPPTREPGTHFLYNSLATYMVSAIVQKITGLTVRDYLMPRLFTPLDIPEPEWDSCPKGINAGGWGLWLSTPEIARFGQFLLQKGVWDGKRLLPQEWVETATSMQMDNSSQSNPDWKVGYGFQFWRCRHGFYRGDGAFGQYCIVMEDCDMVIAMNSGVADMQAILDLVWKHLIPVPLPGPLSALLLAPLPAPTLAPLPTPLPAPLPAPTLAPLSPPLPAPLPELFPAVETKNQLPDEAAALDARCKTLRYAPPALAGSPEEAIALFAGWTGKSWNLSENAFMAKVIGFSSAGRRSFITLEDERGNHKIPFGWGVWEASESTLKRQPGRKRRKFPSFASASWKAPDGLLLTCRFPETPDWYAIEFTRTSDTELEMNITINVSFGPVKTFTVAGKLADAEALHGAIHS